MFGLRGHINFASAIQQHIMHDWILRRRAHRELSHARLPPPPQQCQFAKKWLTWVVYVSST